jgi:hypothetical protein
MPLEKVRHTHSGLILAPPRRYRAAACRRYSSGMCMHGGSDEVTTAGHVYACRKRRLGSEHADTGRMGKEVGDCLCLFREGKVSEE